MIDFSPTREQQALADQVRRFVEERIIPYEQDPRQDAHGPNDDLCRRLLALGAGCSSLQCSG